MDLDLDYVKIYNKIHVSRKIKTSYKLEWREYNAMSVHVFAL